jgi:hypothetical protein
MVTARPAADRDTLAAKLLEGLHRAGYTEIRSTLGTHAHPEAIRWREGDAGHAPCVTARKGEKVHLFEVSVREDFAKLSTEERWRLFSYYAQDNEAVFVIVVDASEKPLAQAELRRLRIQARVMGVGP